MFGFTAGQAPRGRCVGADIDGEAADDNSGTSVSMSVDGQIVAIGASLNDGNGDESGHVRVYRECRRWVRFQ